MKEATSKPVKLSKTDNLNLSWRDTRYHRFYEVVDQLVDEIQEHVWAKTGKPKRRLKGDGLGNLHYSVECLVRDCVAVVLQMHRKGEANLISLRSRPGRPNFVAGPSVLDIGLKTHAKLESR